MTNHAVIGNKYKKETGANSIYRKNSCSDTLVYDEKSEVFRAGLRLLEKENKEKECNNA